MILKKEKHYEKVNKTCNINGTSTFAVWVKNNFEIENHSDRLEKTNISTINIVVDQKPYVKRNCHHRQSVPYNH